MDDHDGNGQPELSLGNWGPAHRIAFRFCFVYFGLYCLATQTLYGFLPLPTVDLPDPSSWWPIRNMVFWAATHIFHVTTPLVYEGSGSGDKTFDWILNGWVLLIALVATPIWSLLDRKRRQYTTLGKWFRVFIRFALAGQMFTYGMDKLIPLQMPYPFLTRLVEPFGNFSPMGVLWSSIGASRSYEMFAGSAEMLGGILLIAPRTTMLGALVCIANLTQVFMLNMTYDVPVKIFSFNLLLMALFLLAPDIPRLFDFFLRNCTVRPSTQPQLFKTARGNRVSVIVQVAFGIALIALNGYGGWKNWSLYGGARPKSPLYGIWEVQQLTIDGQEHPPLLTDKERWRRVIFDLAQRASFQRMDDSYASYGVSFNMNDKTLALTKSNNKDWKANLNFLRTATDQMTLNGTMDGHQVQMQLRLFDRSKFLLVNRGFHWIQEYPLNK